MNNLSKRTITGIFLIIIVIGGIWLHPVSCFIIGGILLAGSLYEYFKLVSVKGAIPQIFSGMITAISVYVISVLVAAGMVDGMFYLIVMIQVMLIIIVELFRKQDKPFDAVAHTIFGTILISVPFSLFPFMTFGYEGPDTIISSNIPDFSPGLILGFLILSWSFDVGAYLFGSWFGKHKLNKRISPEKSWEGFIFGLIITCIVAWPISLWIIYPDIKGWIAIGAIIAVTGTLGDLAESMLKRSVGVKDSGSLLPGHGGILDRFDSLILSLPFLFIFIVLFG